MITWIRCYISILAQSLSDIACRRRNLFFVSAGLLAAFVLFFVVLRIGDREDQNSIFGIVFAIVWLQLLVPITAIYFSAALLREEISNRTIVYMLSGPVPRSSIWLAKYSVSVIASWVIVLGALLLVVVAFQVVPLPIVMGAGDWELEGSTFQACMGVAFVAPFAYAAIGTLLAIRFRRAILWGLGFFIVWESFVGSVPMQSGLRSFTIVDSLRTLLYHGTPGVEGLHEMLFEWSTGNVFGLELPSALDARWTLFYFTVIPLALTLWMGRSRDFESGAKDE